MPPGRTSLGNNPSTSVTSDITIKSHCSAFQSDMKYGPSFYEARLQRGLCGCAWKANVFNMNANSNQGRGGEQGRKRGEKKFKGNVKGVKVVSCAG